MCVFPSKKKSIISSKRDKQKKARFKAILTALVDFDGYMNSRFLEMNVLLVMIIVLHTTLEFTDVIDIGVVDFV